MEVIIRKQAADAEQLTADLIADAIRIKPDLKIGLATGRTMENLYEVLAKKHEDGAIDFSLCKSFNLDEYVGLKGDHINSYRHYMNEKLFNKVNIDLRNTHLPNGAADDLDSECSTYEKLIQACGGIDLQLLGVGRSGHIGFNEPLSAFQSRTRQKALAPETLAQNQPLFEHPDDMPKRAITMGVGTIMDAKRIIMLVTGTEKADILAKAVEGPMTAMISATAIQMHPHCTVIVDEAAASLLKAKDYYNWIFENEPEWEPYR